MEYREFMEIYHTEHYCCPVCGASITVFQIEEN